mmetsp:Transcript_1275/g.1639  ORF Transcript_1275/g.1639 Transcript_1275/m.1639 type:complete len:219 (-) Transcript_1275:8-664(-)
MIANAILLSILTLSNAFIPKLQATRNYHKATTFRQTLRDASEDEAKIIYSFVDPKSQTSIDCYIDKIAEINEEQYLVGYPIDDCVSITIEDNDELVPIPLNDPLIDSVFEDFQKSLKDENNNYELKRTPVTLTLAGLEDDSEMKYDFDDSDLDDDDVEEVELVSELELNNVTFRLLKYVVPIWIIAKKDGENLQLLDDDEDEKVSLEVEKMLDEQSIQ